MTPQIFSMIMYRSATMTAVRADVILLDARSIPDSGVLPVWAAPWGAYDGLCQSESDAFTCHCQGRWIILVPFCCSNANVLG